MEKTEKEQICTIFDPVRPAAVENWRIVFMMIKFVRPLSLLADLCKAYGLLDSLGDWCELSGQLLAAERRIRQV